MQSWDGCLRIVVFFFLHSMRNNRVEEIEVRGFEKHTEQKKEYFIVPVNVANKSTRSLGMARCSLKSV